MPSGCAIRNSILPVILHHGLEKMALCRGWSVGKRSCLSLSSHNGPEKNHIDLLVHCVSLQEPIGLVPFYSAFFIWARSKRILKPNLPTSRHQRPMLNRDPVQQSESWSRSMVYSRLASLSMLLSSVIEVCSSFGKRFPLLAAPIPIGSVLHNSGTRLKIRQTPYNLEASWPMG
jgi:hypothetical protein